MSRAYDNLRGCEIRLNWCESDARELARDIDSLSGLVERSVAELTALAIERDKLQAERALLEASKPERVKRFALVVSAGVDVYGRPNALAGIAFKIFSF